VVPPELDATYPLRLLAGEDDDDEDFKLHTSCCPGLLMLSLARLACVHLCVPQFIRPGESALRQHMPVGSIDCW
jgi:hypothetical protein